MTDPMPGDRDHLLGLNEAQQEAVIHERGPLIVLAGPGTGKTRVIVRRIAHMVTERGIDPASILALTFTNKAAGEMRERLAQQLGALTADRVNAYTFNGFGAMLLRRFSDLAGLPREPDLIDSAQRMRMMRSIVAEQRLFRDAVATGLDSAIGTAKEIIASMTSAGLTPKAARGRLRAREADLDTLGLDDQGLTVERGRLDRLSEIVALWDAFDSECLHKGVISFDHQVAWTNRLLRDKSIAAAFVRQDFRHVVVDEYQDVNNAQIELLGLVAPPEHAPDLCVVGDDDQAIYGFRGADDRAFAKFENKWSGSTTVMLEENYRSASGVLNVAAAVIGSANERFRDDKVIRRPSPGQGVEPQAEPVGAGVEGIRLENYQQAGEAIASIISRDLAERPDAKLSDFAIIGRYWPELHRIRATLEIEGLPCRSSKPRPPSEDPGVLDVMAWIDILLNPSHTWSARRILLRPPFMTTVEWTNTTENAYRVMRSKIEAKNKTIRIRRNEAAANLEPSPQNETESSIPNYLEWLNNGLAGGTILCGDEERTVVERFIALWLDLRRSSATMPAAELIGEIVRRTDVVHAELLDGRARASRVSAVVGLLRFASERSPRLDEPRDLAAFMAYYEDLDESDKSLRSGGLTHEEDQNPEEENEAGGGEAVQILTAHASKGLEFDTVFLPRVESQHGFPGKRKIDSDTALPSWLTGEDHRSEMGALDDEERRVFYVACTRAERRLVMLGKLPKKKPSGVNYLWDLLGQPELITDREAADVLGSFPRDRVHHELPQVSWDASEKRRSRLRDASRTARLEAAGALESAVNTGLNELGFTSISERLRTSAARMAVVGAAQRGEPMPAWIEDQSLIQLHASLLTTENESPVVSASSVLKPMTAPLELSFSKISEWETCPRCFAVRYVLGLPTEQSSKRVIGTAVHRALEEFYKRFALASGSESANQLPTLDDLLSMGERALDIETASTEVIEPDQRDLALALLRNTYEHLHHDRLNPTEMEHEICFSYEHSGTHLFKCKIDRIDESLGGYRVIDYKTGQASKTLVEPEKKDLQFGIYALAMRKFAFGTEPAGVDVDGSTADVVPLGGNAEYWILSTGERGSVSFDELAEYEPKLRSRIDKAIDGMLSGEYPKSSKCRGDCSFLDTSA